MESATKDKIVSKINALYERNNYQEVSSVVLKEELSEFLINQKTTFWGHVLSVMLSAGVIKKNPNRTERIQSNLCYFYGPGAVIVKNKKDSPTHLIIDQFGTKYEYPCDQTLDQIVANIVNKDPKLELTIFKAVKTVKAEVKLITQEI